MRGLRDGLYHVNIWGWKTCDMTVRKNKVVECNYPMKGMMFDEAILWFMDNSPSRGVQIRRAG